MTSKPIILASSSPTRQQQLKRLKIPFQTHSPDIDESPMPGETASQLVLRLSEEKAQTVAQHHPDAWIIAGDQVESIGTIILGKPHTEKIAIEQLSQCSGKTTHFLTGLALLNSKTGELRSTIVTTRVHFKTLSTEEIVTYIKKDTPLKCAGSIKIESQGLLLIERIESTDPFAILGLPITALSELFKASKLNILTDF